MKQDEALKVFRIKGKDLHWAEGIRRGKKVGGTPTLRGYERVQYKGRRYLVHRIVFLMTNGYMPDFVDHIDGDPSNNSPENLRECTQSQNSMNRGFDRHNTSGFKGVTWHKKNKKWQSQVKVSGKNYFIGTFDDISDAALAAKNAREALHIEFANHGE